MIEIQHENDKTVTQKWSRAMIDYQSAQRYAKASVISIVGLQDADDVLQDAALLAWKKREQFRSEADFETWFWRIARNAALCHLRRYNGKERDDSRNAELTPLLCETLAGEQRADSSVLARELYEAISKLNPKRKLAALNWLAGESARGAEKAARHKAKRQLREMLS